MFFAILLLKNIEVDSDEAISFCELDAVTDKIKKDLMDPSSVAPDLSEDKWFTCINHQLQFNLPLICRKLHNLESLLNDLNQVNIFIIHYKGC